jgi:uncharacterized protein
MRSTDTDILIVPGLGNSGPDHWQSRWQAKLSSAWRVEQQDWDRPVLADWTQSIVTAVASARKPMVIIAHSLGVPCVVHAMQRADRSKIAGAFLVSPVDAPHRHHPEIDPAFDPAPRDPLPFPSMVVASRNDIYASYEYRADLANAWGSLLIDAGEAGHINASSGHGPWPEGLMSFAAFLNRLKPPPDFGA